MWFIFIREDLEERREEVAANPMLENLGKRKGLEGTTGCYKRYQHCNEILHIRK